MLGMKIPIRRDETMVSRMCVLYRDWPYREKILNKICPAKVKGKILEV